jgi:hypothetical protein
MTSASPRHARHPVMRSIEPSDTWGWCYVDEAYLEVGMA